MDADLSARMFHVLVVMGAALGGCTARPIGGETDGGSTTGTSTTGDDPGTTTEAPTPVTSSTTSSATSTTSTTSTSTTDDPGTTAAPVIDEPLDCPETEQFHCESYDPLLNCICDPNAPVTPEDCDHPQHFRCEGYWSGGPYGCFCDPNAPLNPDDCAFPVNFNCDQYGTPPTGCSCECSYGPATPQSEDDCAGFGFYYCAFEPYGCCCMIQLG